MGVTRDGQRLGQFLPLGYGQQVLGLRLLGVYLLESFTWTAMAARNATCAGNCPFMPGQNEIVIPEATYSLNPFFVH